jgi:hypothetical protein
VLTVTVCGVLLGFERRITTCEPLVAAELVRLKGSVACTRTCTHARAHHKLSYNKR